MPNRFEEEQPQQTEMPYGHASRVPSRAQSSRVPGRAETESFGGAAAQASVQFEYDEPKLSLAYVNVDHQTWEQAYLARVLQSMKDSEIPKLKFLPQNNKALEYEKWLLTLNTTMQGLHQEIGTY